MPGLAPIQDDYRFHNMTSAGIGYLTLCDSSEREFVRWDLLEALPGEGWQETIASTEASRTC
jgi:hypothetical protein